MTLTTFHPGSHWWTPSASWAHSVSGIFTFSQISKPAVGGSEEASLPHCHPAMSCRGRNMNQGLILGATRKAWVCPPRGRSWGRRRLRKWGGGRKGVESGSLRPPPPLPSGRKWSWRFQNIKNRWWGSGFLHTGEREPQGRVPKKWCETEMGGRERKTGEERR